MTIRFICDHCGHHLEAADALQGRHGKCKHCGRALIVPSGNPSQAEPSLRLQPPDDADRGRAAAHLLEEQEPLKLQSAGPERKTWPKAVSLPEERLSSTGPANYGVAASPLSGRARHFGPPPVWMRLPSWSARLAARGLRRAREFLYLISVASLVAVLLGFVFKAKAAMHIGAVAIVAANGGMLCVALAYLVTLPFRESLRQGLACLLLPGYAVYYWATRWAKMRRPVWNTLSAFVPILLVTLAYVFYEEEPALKSAVEQRLPRLEQSVDQELDRVDSLLDGSAHDKHRLPRRPDSR